LEPRIASGTKFAADAAKHRRLTILIRHGPETATGLFDQMNFLIKENLTNNAQFNFR
jgi:hypothetical protein